MRAKIALAITLMIGTALAVIFGDESPTIGRKVGAQTGTGCGSFRSRQDTCGESGSCGLGLYTISDEYLGPGINGNEPRSVSCAGTTCGSINDVPTAFFDPSCCDQDNDGVSSIACGGNDCNDNDPLIRPSATEVCDGKDNNCNGQIDEGFDHDGDGYKTCTGDCNDNNSNVHPGATETCGDGIDNDCSGGDAPCPTPCEYQQEELPGIESGSYELNCEICFDGIDNDCVNGQDWEDYHCIDCYSPVAIDTLGDGFDLTGAEDGVDFDIAGIGRPVRVSWTQGDDAWIALDLNGNGTIDSGRELFGSATSQPGSTGRNGFLALAEYDKATNAGNGDGVIDSRDAIFSSLRLWLDSNHNGFSEQSELHTLPSLGVAQLDLDYRESGRVDAHGNRFRYRAKVRDSQGSDLGRWAWDVFLRTESVTRENEFVLPQDHRVFSFSKPRCKG